MCQVGRGEVSSHLHLHWHEHRGSGFIHLLTFPVDRSPIDAYRNHLEIAPVGISEECAMQGRSNFFDQVGWHDGRAGDEQLLAFPGPARRCFLFDRALRRRLLVEREGTLARYWHGSLLLFRSV
jgi:hypothetical protein